MIYFSDRSFALLLRAFPKRSSAFSASFSPTLTLRTDIRFLILSLCEPGVEPDGKMGLPQGPAWNRYSAERRTPTMSDSPMGGQPGRRPCSSCTMCNVSCAYC